MFDFTKEVIINNVESFKLVPSEDSKAGNGKNNARGDKFRVHGGGDYFANYVMGDVYVTEPQTGRRAVLTINAANIVSAIKNDDKHFQLSIEAGLDRDARSDWSTAVYLWKKPLTIDAFAKDWASGKENYNLAKLLKAVLTDYKFVHVLHGEEDAALANELGVENYDAGLVSVVGADYNVKINKISLTEAIDEKLIDIFAGSIHYMDSDQADVMATLGFDYVSNAVEFGTYNYMLHNLRMPTYENYRFTSPAAVEMPVAGADYVQFSFLYCVPRPGLGGLSVAGQYNHSVTTHVFFVKSGDVADEFKNVFSTFLGRDFIEVNHDTDKQDSLTILPDNFAAGSSVIDGDGGEDNM